MPTFLYLWLGANGAGVLIYVRLCFILGRMMKEVGPDGSPLQDIGMYCQDHQVLLLKVFLAFNCIVLALGLWRGSPRSRDRMAGAFFVMALVWIWIYANDSTLGLIAAR